MQQNFIRTNDYDTAQQLLKMGFQKIDEKYDAAQCPGNGIGHGHGGKPVHQLHRHGDIADPDHTPAGQHGKHGHGGFTRTSHNAGDAVGEGQQAVEQADGAHMLCAKVNGLLRFAEEADQLRRKYIGNNADDFCHQTAANNAETNAFFNPGMVACAQILSHEGGKRLRKAAYRQKSKAFQLGITGGVDVQPRHLQTGDKILLLDACGLAEGFDTAADHVAVVVSVCSRLHISLRIIPF